MLFIKREVKMAGYWPSWFLSINGRHKVEVNKDAKRREANVQPPKQKKLRQ